uniref:Uncharacterized protein n=1 Tax=Sus scrofa TaxID=9823 RepID=A0A8D1U904_PIG
LSSSQVKLTLLSINLTLRTTSQNILYKENVGKGTPTPVTPEMQRVKRNQENISSVIYKENLGKATPTPFTPEMERVKRNQENFSSVFQRGFPQTFIF